MRDRFYSLLGVESDEESTISLLLAQSVFLGIFFGYFDVTSHSLFLAIFDEKMMARGYVASGIAGIILTSLYSWFQKRTQFKNFAVTNLIFLSVITIILWISLILSPSKWVIFIVFIMLGPLIILALLGLHGTTGRLVTLRQERRWLKLVDAGLLIGIIISCYSIPVLLSLKIELHNIMLAGASSVFVAAVIQIMIGARARLLGVNNERKPLNPVAEKFILMDVFRDPYARIVVIFLFLSAITMFFIQYSFMAVTREQFPSGENMACFLGIFTGSMTFFTLLVNLSGFKYLIRNFGLQTCLAISSVLVAVITALALITGMAMGYTPESMSGFLIFFILLALSRLISVSLKAGIEIPSFKIICQAIDEKIKYEIQSGMNGTLYEIAALLSGLLLAGLGFLSFFKLIHFSLVLLFIILIWIFVAFRLYSEFRKSIRKTLEKDVLNQSGSGAVQEQSIFKSRFSAYRKFKMDYFSLITGDYSVLENNNKWYYEKIINHSYANQDVNLIPVLKKISINPVINEEVRNQSTELVKILEKVPSSGNIQDDKISFAKKTLSGTRQPQTTEILRLLRDNSIEAKRMAIYMTGKFKFSELLPEVCECLNIAGLEADASTVLRTFGKDAEDELVRFYLISSGNSNTSKTILRLLGKINSKESIGFLFSRLWSNSRQLKEVAVNCLIECNFKAAGEDKNRLILLISDIIGFMTWNLSAKVCFEKNNDKFLLGLIRKEIDRWNIFLFNILSITYDSGTIAKIRINLEKETVESISLARELIDIVIDDDIKPKLISLLNIGKDYEKLKNLHQFYPGAILQYSKLLDAIVNRDYNLLSLWTKACTLRNLPDIIGDEMHESVVALLFSPEEILQEESAKLIARTSREFYRSDSHRIPDSTRKRLDNIIDGVTNEMELLFEKIVFLSNYFKGIPEEELFQLARSMKYIKDLKSGFPSFSDGYIIWSLSDGKQVAEVNFYYAGQLKRQGENYHTGENTAFYILPFDEVEKYLNLYPDKSYEILKYIDNNEK